jgi:hypothetical protein
MRFAISIFALAVFAAVLSPRSVHAEEAPAAAKRATDERARFRGSFRFVGSSREQAARQAAIDRGVDSLFFMIRGIARSRLSAGTKIDPSVAFAFDGTNIHVRIPAATEAISPESGAAVDYVNAGERTRLSQRISAGRLMQLFVAGQGQRANEWVLLPDDRTLLLKVTVSSTKLSAPVIYTLTYQRSP